MKLVMAQYFWLMHAAALLHFNIICLPVRNFAAVFCSAVSSIKRVAVHFLWYLFDKSLASIKYWMLSLFYSVSLSHFHSIYDDSRVF